jgi:DNA replication protein DnaC
MDGDVPMRHGRQSIGERNDVVAIGPDGRGKTHAALAIGYEAVKRGYSVKFKRAGDSVNEMGEAKSAWRTTSGS